jgi:hypothetical protein
MSPGFSKSQIALAVTTALAAAATMSTAHANGNDRDRKTEGTYVTGDFHNHTTCSDGSISMEKLVKKATDTVDTPWGLDWFVQSGHGGNGNRNCTLVEDASLATPAFPLVYASDGKTVQGPTTTWQNSTPPVQPKGLVSGVAPNQNMWRWQSIQEYQYPVLEYLSAAKSLPLFIGVETNSPGHEHVSMSVIEGQMPKQIFKTPLPTQPGYTPLGNANPLAHWEYCFDRNDTDTSRGNTAVGSGVGNNFDCSVSGSLNAADPSWNATAQKLIPASGTGNGNLGHSKAIEGMRWLMQNNSKTSYYVPAHLERAGPFNPNGNNGYNIEHLRDFNNAAPTVAFGMETQPGHGASDARGEYTIRRNNIGGVNVDSVGGTTYGGVGVYGAQIGGVWDSLLGEGRNFWYFTSSDWHNRGIFGPDDRRSTQDFFPGEYQRDFVMVRHARDNKGWDRHERKKKHDDVLTPASVVDGLRTGNSFTSSGQLIDRLAFVACAVPGSARPTPARDAVEKTLVETAAVAAALKNTDVDFDSRCATMGEKLEVHQGQDVIVSIVIRDPSGKNYAPYSFSNPSLLQVGIKRPINAPVLDHVDVVRGLVTGYRKPGAPDYAGQWPSDWISNPNLANVPAGAKNTTAAIYRTFNADTWATVQGDKQFKRMTFRISGVKASQYLRLRGTNMPAAVDYETDANGNPLPDLYTNAGAVNPTVPGGTDGQPAGANLKIPCTTAGTTEFDGCPAHLATVSGQKYSSYDVAAWSDLWFYSNPIFIEVKGSTLVAGL